MLTSLLFKTISAVLGAWLLVSIAIPERVLAQGQCFTELADCFLVAAGIESFWYRTWSALDCELGLIACVRITVFGL